MGRITMVGKSIARVGETFTYLGSSEACGSCDYDRICNTLQRGRTYRITSVRDVEHECALEEEEKAVVVEFEPLPVLAAVPAKRVLEGAVITLEKEGCDLAWCPNYRLCRKLNPARGERIRIVDVKGTVDCPKGHSLKSVEVALVRED